MALEKTLAKSGAAGAAEPHHHNQRGSIYEPGADPTASTTAPSAPASSSSSSAESRLHKLSRAVLPPAETAAFLDSVTKAQPTSGKVSSFIGVSEGGFTHQRWTAQHLKRGAHQWRMFVMAHFLTDIRSIASQASRRGSVGCIAYTLGPVVSTMPFQHEVSAGLNASNDADGPQVGELLSGWAGE